MDSEVKLYLGRAEDEFLLAKKDFQISINNGLKETLGIPKYKTFFHSVITHAYYAIFYCAKAYLLSKGIKTRPPEEHKRTYEEFRKIITKEKFNSNLVKVYEDEVMKARTLLEIFSKERMKRGRFTYHVRSEANIPYAKESIENAKMFLITLKIVLEV